MWVAITVFYDVLPSVINLEAILSYVHIQFLPTYLNGFMQYAVTERYWMILQVVYVCMLHPLHCLLMTQ